MVGPLPYQKRHEYPHLSKREAAIWERYIDLYPDRFDEVWYDVELGTPRNFNPNIPENYQRHHKYLGGYKIDVLGRKGDVYTIIELKRQATTKAIGEIDMYEFLYSTYKNPGALVEEEIVTDEEMPHVREWCEKWNVKLSVVPVLPEIVQPSGKPLGRDDEKQNHQADDAQRNESQ